MKLSIADLLNKASFTNIKISNFRDLFRDVSRRLIALPIIGGLSVSDSSLRYAEQNEDGSVKIAVSVKLPPGIVEKGEIKDKPSLVLALKQLHLLANLETNFKKEVVLSLPSNLVYSQVFSLPNLSNSSLPEAIDLNIKMISPLNIEESYYGYEFIGDSDNGFGKDLLASFINIAISNSWSEAVKEGGFLPVATEFHSLSIARLTANQIDNKIHLLVNFLSEGIGICLLKNTHLIFDYFVAWETVRGNENRIAFTKLKDVLFSELNKVINFSRSKFGGEVQSILVNAEGMESQIIDGIKLAFPNLMVQVLKMPSSKALGYASSIGSAKRGILFRSDEGISLSPVSVIREYEENRIVGSVILWRKLAVITLFTLLLVFSVSNLLLFRFYRNIGGGASREMSQLEMQEYARLKNTAFDFNSLVSSISKLQTEETKISSLIQKISEYAGEEIRFSRFSFQSLEQPININGIAPSMESVLAFHKRLLQVEGISNVQLPLSAVQVSQSGETAFAISFNITSLL